MNDFRLAGLCSTAPLFPPCGMRGVFHFVTTMFLCWLLRFSLDNLENPGWRYGIVILMDDGSVRYGEMHRNQQDTVRATVPEGADRVMFVVVGAADRVVPNPWDEDERTDFQMPYRIRINSTGDVDGH